MQTNSCAEYIWIDGTNPTKLARSKTKILKLSSTVKITDFPEWNFDGSSTNQATGHNSDLVLQPVSFVKDPLRGEGNYLVLCEVMKEDGTPHPTNTRAELRRVLDKGASKELPWMGFEQEYTLFDPQTSRPLQWPEAGYPGPQGPYYCGVGASKVYGRPFIEAHTKACIDAGLMIFGTNAEVMPAQWEYQIGPRGFDHEDASPLNTADHSWFARWLLNRIGEDFGVDPSFANKPIRGDWNGAGHHTNFSTQSTRDSKTGMAAMEKAISLLAKKHNEHIAVYGNGLEERLTGHHETCHITQFRSGVADRGASIRIPRSVAAKGYGYLEDRRPGANSDPYEVAARILKTICEIE